MSNKAQYNTGPLALLAGDQIPLQVDAQGRLKVVVVGDAGSASDVTSLDTSGNPVPVWKAHTFTYDGSGNLSTDTVTDGTNTWVRTLMWMNGALTTDSGWVKQ